MSTAAHIDGGWVNALSVGELQRLVDRLPAAQRAELAWAPRELSTALERIANAVESNENVDAAIDACLRVLVRTGSIAVKLVNGARVQGDLETRANQDLASLRRYIDDPAAADAATWAARACLATFDFFLTLFAHPAAADVMKAAMVAPDPEDVLDLTGEPGAGIMRAQALLMATFEAVDRVRSPMVVEALTWRAFEEAHAGIASMHAAGIQIDPFRDETAAARGERARRYAQHVRVVMADADDAVVRGSRIDQLR